MAIKTTSKGAVMDDLSMSGFADLVDLKKHYQLKSDSFFLGKIHTDHGANFKAGTQDDRHIIGIAQTRAGKGTTILIPNLITWGVSSASGGGLFCIDPKGENASITAIRRGTREGAKGTGTTVTKFIGQQVAILDPYQLVQGAAKAYRINYNPLSDIDMNSVEATDKIFTVAESLVIQEEGNGAHFTESVETILAGVIEAVLSNEREQHQHLPFCVEIVRGGYESLLNYLRDTKTQAGLAQEAATLIEDAGAEEYGSFRTTLSRQLRFMFDMRMQNHLQTSGFSLEKAIQNNWSVYVVAPPSKLGRVSRWLRVLTRIAIDAKMNSPFEHQGQQSLFVLDEFAALGTLKILEESAGYAAGYGVKLMPVIQNIGQIKRSYPKNWETFLGNAGTIISWGLNDLETEQYISDRMGKVFETEQGYSESVSRSPEKKEGSQYSLSRNTGIKERAVRWPNEIHYQGAREQMRGFVISAASKPFITERVNYWDLFKANEYEAPQAIVKWEANHG